MPVIFGDAREDGLIKVGSIQWQIASHPNGISVNSVPEYPTPIKGKTYIMLLNPETKDITFESVDRLLTSEELQENFNTMLSEKLDTLINLLSPK
jgi:hypothetical protein